MLTTLKRLKSDEIVDPPQFLIDNTMYLCMMGSVAYGVSTDMSDVDVYGFCMPPLGTVFPHAIGMIHGFDRPQEFEQWQQHHCMDKSSGKEYDFSVYSIIKYFRLVADNNPNMIDSLFVPRNCVLHSTQISEHVRENRNTFLHKGSWHKFKGYAYSQLHKMNIKNPKPESKRYKSIMEHGYDVKFAYHVVRLLNEIEQIMTEHTIDLQRNREQLKSIRRGEWTVDEIINFAKNKELELEKVYLNCKLPYSAPTDKIRQILTDCLEMHYGSIDKLIKSNSSKNDEIVMKIRDLLA